MSDATSTLAAEATETDVLCISMLPNADIEDVLVMLNGARLHNVTKLELVADTAAWAPQVRITLACPELDVRVPAIIATVLVASSAEDAARMMGVLEDDTHDRCPDDC